MARKFVKDWTGQDLKQWHLTELHSTAHLNSDKLIWYYNTSNTMHKRLYVYVTQRQKMSGNRITARFDVFWIGSANTSNQPPLKKIGTGAATLRRQAQNWVVASWQFARKD